MDHLSGMTDRVAMQYRMHGNIQLEMTMVAKETHFSSCMVSRSFKSLVISRMNQMKTKDKMKMKK